MNTALKSVSILECTKCPKNYMKAGETAIALSQHRPAHRDPHTGRPLEGVCPDHRGEYGTKGQ